MHTVIFYVIAAVMLTATGMAVTRKNLVHAVVYLVVSFFGSAMLFYLMGAPLLAALEIIIYAGAIMILFLFLIMMMRMDQKLHFRSAGPYVPAVIMCIVYLVVIVQLYLHSGPQAKTAMTTAVAEPGVFGIFLFQTHWLSIEVVSLLLLIALVGAMHLGLSGKKSNKQQREET